MASNINFTDIDENFPVAGQDNDSQGFRDNFSTIKTSLNNAKSEIETLQTNTAKTNEDNDFNNSLVSFAKFKANSYQTFDTIQFTTSGTIDWDDGHFQNVTVAGNATITLDSFPANSQYGHMRLSIRSNNSDTRTITFEAAQSGTLRLNPSWPESNATLVISSDTTPTIVDVYTTDSGATVFLEYVGKFNTASAGPDVIPFSTLTITNDLSVGGNTTIQGNLTVTGTLGQEIEGTIDDIANIGNVEITTLADGDFLSFSDADGAWVNTGTINATTVTLSDSGDENASKSIILADSATGTNGLETDDTLTYNPSTGTLTCTTIEANFQGDIFTNSGSVKAIDATTGKMSPQIFIIPEYTTAARDAGGIGVPRSLIYNSTDEAFQVYDPSDSSWKTITIT
jgi:hypothetical protein